MDRPETEPVFGRAPDQPPESDPDSAVLDTMRDDEAFGPASIEQLAEEERLHRKIPRVRPRTTAELDVEPPPRQRYPVRIGKALRELIRSREILFTFVERDLRVRYKQALLGAFWAVLQPLMLMVVFTIVFGRIARIGSEGIPYPIFAYSALVPWQFFASSVNLGTSSIIANWATIRKIYLPRETFPLAAVMSSGVDFLVSSVILLGMLLAYGMTPRVTWVAFPLLVLILLFLMTAVTMAVSAVTAYFRDTRYGMPMLLQILMFASPIAYPMSEALRALPSGIRGLYPYLNPLAPVMDGFRRVLVHGEWPDWAPLGSAAGVGVVGLFLVYWWYKRIDRNFADVI
ncbi:MAG: ABC transporter permease [Actinobacteria bacterium]|nr:ABC transporter permease [Actinomycetota bacterium]